MSGDPNVFLLGRSNVYGLTVVPPCRVKSFRKTMTAVMDDLVKVLANKIIDNLHLMLNINLCSKLALLKP